MGLNDLGIDAKAGVAGLIGGFFAWVTMMKQLDPKQAFISITGGFAIATYCTELVMYFLNIPEQYKAGMGFAIGLFGLAIVGKVLVLIDGLSAKDFKDFAIDWTKQVLGTLLEVFKRNRGG